MGSRVTSEQHSLVASQQQKKDWEKIFVESEIAQDMRRNRDEKTKDVSNQDAGADKMQYRIGWSGVLPDEKLINLKDNLATASNASLGVNSSGSSTNSVDGKASDKYMIHAKSHISTAHNETRVVIPVVNQGLQLKEPDMVKPGSNSPHTNNSFAKKDMVGKVGLHIYRTELGELKIWMRDSSISNRQGVLIIRELKGIFSKIGVSLATFTLNGEMLYSDYRETESLTEGEVTL